MGGFANMMGDVMKNAGALGSQMVKGMMENLDAETLQKLAALGQIQQQQPLQQNVDSQNQFQNAASLFPQQQQSFVNAMQVSSLFLQLYKMLCDCY